MIRVLVRELESCMLAHNTTLVENRPDKADYRQLQKIQVCRMSANRHTIKISSTALGRENVQQYWRFSLQPVLVLDRSHLI